MPGELQRIKDILRYTSHSDPQLKGNTAIVIGHLVGAALIEGRGDFDKWLKTETHKGCNLLCSVFILLLCYKSLNNQCITIV